jgi:nifR3 family TIM-barrel protein
MTNELTAAQPAFHIGGLPVFGRLALSPMDGYSDLPFRSLCRSLGSALSYTEFINAIDVLGGGECIRRVRQRAAFLPAERPVVFQIFDSEPARLAEAALRLQEFGPDVIDVNMGCSDSSVAGRGAGAGLLQTPHKIAEIFCRLTGLLEVPVTGKIRLGWDDDSRNYLEVARIIEDNGGALIAVHGRTRRQAYGGQADWDAIAEVRQAVRIPVLGNGDVRTLDDARLLLDHTGCAGALIGRAARGNPWLFAGLERGQVSPAQVRQTICQHLERSLAFYGEERGLVLFRKHARNYLAPWLDGCPESKRRALLTAEHPAEFLSLVDGVIEESVPFHH